VRRPADRRRKRSETTAPAPLRPYTPRAARELLIEMGQAADMLEGE
jgi:hypothetical protein